MTKFWIFASIISIGWYSTNFQINRNLQPLLNGCKAFLFSAYVEQHPYILPPHSIYITRFAFAITRIAWLWSAKVELTPWLLYSGATEKMRGPLARFTTLTLIWVPFLAAPAIPPIWASNSQSSIHLSMLLALLIIIK